MIFAKCCRNSHNQLQHLVELKSNENSLDCHHFPMKNCYSWGYSLPDRPIFCGFKLSRSLYVWRVEAGAIITETNMCHVSFAIFGLRKGNICQKPEFFPVHQEVSGKFSHDTILGHLIRHSTVVFSFQHIFNGFSGACIYWHDHLP